MNLVELLRAEMGLLRAAIKETEPEIALGWILVGLAGRNHPLYGPQEKRQRSVGGWEKFGYSLRAATTSFTGRKE